MATGAGTGAGDGSGGSGGNGGSNTTSGSNTTGASGGAGGVGGGGGGSVADCNALEQDVDAKLSAAQVCSLLAPQSGDCKSNVPGKCCAVVIDQPGSDATTDYLAALATFQHAGCVAPCPDSLCDPDPHGTCDAGPSLTSGVCTAH
jgi:hypothetical protein